jgi:hypothetical protein
MRRPSVVVVVVVDVLVLILDTRSKISQDIPGRGIEQAGLPYQKKDFGSMRSATHSLQRELSLT